mgnify:CR=1 FL=1
MGFMTLEIEGVWYSVEDDSEGKYLYAEGPDERIELNELQWALIMNGVKNTMKNGLTGQGESLTMDDLMALGEL